MKTMMQQNGYRMPHKGMPKGGVKKFGLGSMIHQTQKGIIGSRPIRDISWEQSWGVEVVMVMVVVMVILVVAKVLEALEEIVAV